MIKAETQVFLLTLMGRSFYFNIFIRLNFTLKWCFCHIKYLTSIPDNQVLLFFNKWMLNIV